MLEPEINRNDFSRKISDNTNLLTDRQAALNMPPTPQGFREISPYSLLFLPTHTTSSRKELTFQTVHQGEPLMSRKSVTDGVVSPVIH